MSQILVWKSDADGKLFEDKAKYTSHLRKLARERTRTRKIQEMRNAREQFLIDMGKNVTSIAELEQFVANNWAWFFLNGLSHEWSGDKKSYKDVHTLVGFKLDGMYWNANISNTHAAPRNGGITNWSREADKPKGYPGWGGTLNIKVRTPQKTYKREPYYEDGFGSGYVDDTTIFTGSGGGGGCKDGVTSYRYDVKLFAADFPGMVEALVHDQFEEVLRGERQYLDYCPS
jgi:hypothetical protein